MLDNLKQILPYRVRKAYDHIILSLVVNFKLSLKLQYFTFHVNRISLTWLIYLKEGPISCYSIIIHGNFHFLIIIIMELNASEIEE